MHTKKKKNPLGVHDFNITSLYDNKLIIGAKHECHKKWA